MNFQGEYVYVLQENEGANIYKIGRSRARYPNHAQMCMIVKVTDSLKAEKYIIGQLKQYYGIVHRRDIGAEYFQRDLYIIMSTMINVSHMLCEKPKVLQDPLLTLGEFLIKHNSILEGSRVDGLSLYKSLMQEGGMPETFTYNKLVAFLAKYKVKELESYRGPVLVFPREEEKEKEKEKEKESVLKSHDECVIGFVNDHIVRDANAYFTLKQAKAVYVSSEYFDGRVSSLKADLQKILNCPCQRGKNVFMGYKVVC